MDLKDEFGLTYVFISHDLNVVRYICDRVMVMYLGKIAEIGSVDAVFDASAHTYTAALLSSMPSIDPDNRTQIAPLAGDPPNPIDPPSGCRFHTRCAFARAVCSLDAPRVRDLGARHRVACHRGDPASGYGDAAEAVPAPLAVTGS